MAGTSASSIKTRIKTNCQPILWSFVERVRVHLPLKQGLRRLYFRFTLLIELVRVHLPLKQGLRLCFFVFNCFYTLVRVHLPLKQGLRQISIMVCSTVGKVRVHLPLKQGLRQNMWLSAYISLVDVRVHLPLKQGLRRHNVGKTPFQFRTSASSIKTRIKTPKEESLDNGI